HPRDTGEYSAGVPDPLDVRDLALVLGGAVPDAGGAAARAEGHGVPVPALAVGLLGQQLDVALAPEHQVPRAGLVPAHVHGVAGGPLLARSAGQLHARLAVGPLGQPRAVELGRPGAAVAVVLLALAGLGPRQRLGRPGVADGRLLGSDRRGVGHLQGDRAGIGGTGALSGRVRADTGGEQCAQNERGQQVTGHHGDAFLLSRVLVVVDDRDEVGDDGPPVGAGGPFAYSG